MMGKNTQHAENLIINISNSSAGVLQEKIHRKMEA